MAKDKVKKKHEYPDNFKGYFGYAGMYTMATVATALVSSYLSVFLTDYSGIDSSWSTMIATLILYTCGRSIAYWINGGATPTISSPIITGIGSFIPGIPIPTPVIIVIAAAIILHLVFHFTSLELLTQSVGINGSAARLNGINTTWIKLLSFIILGLCVAVSGCIGVCRLGLINHETLLLDVEMDTILAVAIGGNNLGGGKFKVIGSIIGAYVIQMLTITLYAMKVPSTDVKAYKAIVIIILVVIGSPVFKSRIEKIMNQRKERDTAVTAKGAG